MTSRKSPSPSVHHLVKFLATQLVIERMTRVELARLSGVPQGTLKDWWEHRRGGSPSLPHLESCLAVFGYELKPTPIEKKK